MEHDFAISLHEAMEFPVFHGITGAYLHVALIIGTQLFPSLPRDVIFDDAERGAAPWICPVEGNPADHPN
jgi:hypothetical protein